MANITAPIDTQQRAGNLVTVPVAAALHLYPGGLIARDASGNAVPASDTAGLRVVGRNETDADNSTGAAGDITTQVGRGIFCYANSLSDAVAKADIGNLAFVEDDQTVNKTGGTNKIEAGRIVDIDDSGVWVDTADLQPLPVTLALTSTVNSTPAAVDLATAEALANANKAQGNALRADLVALLAKLS